MAGQHLDKAVNVVNGNRLDNNIRLFMKKKKDK